MQLILCEKPSQARDIAAVLGTPRKAEGYITSGEYVLTWGFGHLLELFMPDEYHPEWKRWEFNNLPIFPSEFELSVKKSALKQQKVIEGLIKEAALIIIGTDADREGEMIARELMEHASYTGPVKRLWLSALDPASIKKGFLNLKDGSETESLYFSARARSRADWMVGINLTRGFTLRCGGKNETLNIGRVQSPTFALVVKRDGAINSFNSRDYFAINITTRGASGEVAYLQYDPKDDLRIYDRGFAETIAGAVNGLPFPLMIEVTEKKKSPPALFSLSGFQKKANVLWGWSAINSLNILQALYEKHKATTYPRSDCSFLPEEQISDIPSIISHVSETLALNLPSGFQPIIRKNVFCSSKVTAHHAIIPTRSKADLSVMTNDEQQAYELIARHYIASLFPDYEYDQTVIKIVHFHFNQKIEFSTRGTVPKNQGWLEILKSEKSSKSDDIVLPDFQNGETGIVLESEVLNKKTKPPKRYTEGTLIADMESIGKYVEDPQLKKRLKETAGLGTEATRAGIIAALIKNDFLANKGKEIHSTEKSNRLYEIIMNTVPQLINPEVTALWEQSLEGIASGLEEYCNFEHLIRTEVGNYIKALSGIKPNPIREVMEKIETSFTSVHPDHAGEKIFEDELSWYDPFYGKIFKNIAGRLFTFEEISNILHGNDTTMFEFTLENRTFTSKLRYKGQHKKYKSAEFEFVRDAPPMKDTGLKSEKYGIVSETDDYVSIEKIKGRIFKKMFGRVFSIDEIIEIVDSKSGIKYELFSEKKHKKYIATMLFKPRKKPFPKIELKF